MNFQEAISKGPRRGHGKACLRRAVRARGQLSSPRRGSAAPGVEAPASTRRDVDVTRIVAQVTFAALAVALLLRRRRWPRPAIRFRAAA